MTPRPLVTAATAAALLLSLTACTSQEHEPEQASFALTSDALTIDADKGGLSVTTGDVEEVEVTRRLSSSSLGGAPEATWELTGDTLELRVRCAVFGDCSAEYEVVVPADTALTLRTGNGDVTAAGLEGALAVDTGNGHVSVSDIAGNLTLESSNGDLTGEGLTSGRVEAATSNGRVDLGLTAVPDAVEVRTTNGDADVTLPEGAYDVDASSGNGEVLTQVDTDPASPHRVEVRSTNGRVRVLTASS